MIKTAVRNGLNRGMGACIMPSHPNPLPQKTDDTVILSYFLAHKLLSLAMEQHRERSYEVRPARGNIVIFALSVRPSPSFARHSGSFYRHLQKRKWRCGAAPSRDGVF
jgi:hypothetical protein